MQADARIRDRDAEAGGGRADELEAAGGQVNRVVGLRDHIEADVAGGNHIFRRETRST